jgi:hypothetical protein
MKYFWNRYRKWMNDLIYRFSKNWLQTQKINTIMLLEQNPLEWISHINKLEILIIIEKMLSLISRENIKWKNPIIISNNSIAGKKDVVVEKDDRSTRKSEQIHSKMVNYLTRLADRPMNQMAYTAVHHFEVSCTTAHTHTHTHTHTQEKT